LLTLVVVVGVLYFARTVFVPISLAVLFTFLLAPLVHRLCRSGLGRIPSVISVVVLSFGILGVIFTLMASQLTDLAHKLPGYQATVHKKMQELRTSGGGLINHFSRLFRNVTDELTPSAPPAHSQPLEEKPVPVEIRRSPFSPLDAVQKVLGSLLSIALTAGVVIVFVIFMLLEHKDLRDRVLRIAGAQRMRVTTEVLDDAAHRVSRYLLAQLAINLGYGVLVGLGLFFLGIPNPLLWGMAAALLRYIPYLGIWIAALMSAAVAFAVEPGWGKVPAVFGLFVGIDLLMYNFAEPLLYGSSTGVSPLAILVAAVFWTWLWGPVGLLLSTPLTVCVVVIGRHAPSLSFLQILLSDEPILPLHSRFYQRMLAMDLDEATEIAQEFLKSHSLEELFDRVMLPALSMAEEERHGGRLSPERQQFIFQNTRLLVDELAVRADSAQARSKGTELAGIGESSTDSAPESGSPYVECVPARDEADEIAAIMLVQLLRNRGISAKALPSGFLAGESLEIIGRERPRVTCVLAVPPLGYMHARYLCRRFRAQFQKLKLVVAILTEGDIDELKSRQPTIPADEMACSLKQAQAQVVALLPVKGVGRVDSLLDAA
jgi:predicted PurR-regulated permease PerM